MITRRQRLRALALRRAAEEKRRQELQRQREQQLWYRPDPQRPVDPWVRARNPEIYEPEDGSTIEVNTPVFRITVTNVPRRKAVTLAQVAVGGAVAVGLLWGFSKVIEASNQADE